MLMLHALGFWVPDIFGCSCSGIQKIQKILEKKMDLEDLGDSEESRSLGVISG